MLLWTVSKTYVARALHQAAVISPYPRHTASSQWKCNVRCELTIFIATTASIFCFAYYSANSAFKDRLEMQVGLTIICLRLKGGGSYSDCCSSKQMLLVAEINLLMVSACKHHRKIHDTKTCTSQVPGSISHNQLFRIVYFYFQVPCTFKTTEPQASLCFTALRHSPKRC